MSEWISVEDRLPEDDFPKDTDRLMIKVLVCSTSGKYGVRTLSRQRWIMNFKQNTYSPWQWSKDARNITHWMPLPEPPEERSHGCEYCTDDDCPPLDWQYGLDHILPDYKFCPMCGRKLVSEE